jgi:hypothetical protein
MIVLGGVDRLLLNIITPDDLQEFTPQGAQLGPLPVQEVRTRLVRRFWHREFSLILAPVTASAL